MHDIKAIRDNPEAFDAGLKRRGLAALSPSLLAIDETPPRGDPGVGAGAGAAQRGVEGNRRRQEGQGRGARGQADGRGRRTQDHDAGTRGGGEDGRRRARKELAAIPNLPLDEVPDGTDEHGNVQRHVFGKAPRIRVRAKAA